MQPVVHAQDVTKRFGSTIALQDVSIEVMPGEAHALVGRNGAGKSTLVSLLTGLDEPDAGRVYYDGVPAPPRADRGAWQQKVACVYQHSMTVPALSVAENLFLNRYPVRAGGTIAWETLHAQARALLEEWAIGIDVRLPAAALNVEERQLVEIVRALSFGARFIILDEPTAHLDGAGIDRLFAHLRTLKVAGVTMLFISHHLSEVYEICDRVTVLRDARKICTRPVSELPQAELIEAMTGEEGGLRVPEGRADPAGAAQALDVRSLRTQGVPDVSFCVRDGEIVGLAGIGGSGKTAIAEAIAGLRDASGGVVVEGRPIALGNPRAAIRAGIGLVPRDRHREGLVLHLSVGENATLTVDDRFGPAGFIAPAQRRRAALALMERLGIVAARPEQPVGELSGGNQQKVVFARALARRPNVLVLIHPTAGVDVKSKEALLRDVESARERGAAILVVSDEIDDLRICDRILVVFAGRIIAELPAGWREAELIAHMEGIVATGLGA